MSPWGFCPFYYVLGRKTWTYFAAARVWGCMLCHGVCVLLTWTRLHGGEHRWHSNSKPSPVGTHIDAVTVCVCVSHMHHPCSAFPEQQVPKRAGGALTPDQQEWVLLLDSPNTWLSLVRSRPAQVLIHLFKRVCHAQLLSLSPCHLVTLSDRSSAATPSTVPLKKNVALS